MSPDAIMPLWQGLFTIFAVALITQITRWLPFAVFANRRVPDRIVYLGEVLPYGMMALLVIYCLRALPILENPGYSFSIMISVALTAVVQYWKNHMLFSIAAGTIVHMILVQWIFCV